jgi:hypothetical protein
MKGFIFSTLLLLGGALITFYWQTKELLDILMVYSFISPFLHMLTLALIFVLIGTMDKHKDKYKELHRNYHGVLYNWLWIAIWIKMITMGYIWSGGIGILCCIASFFILALYNETIKDINK